MIFFSPQTKLRNYVNIQDQADLGMGIVLDTTKAYLLSLRNLQKLGLQTWASKQLSMPRPSVFSTARPTPQRTASEGAWRKARATPMLGSNMEVNASAQMFHPYQMKLWTARILVVKWPAVEMLTLNAATLKE